MSTAIRKFAAFSLRWGLTVIVAFVFLFPLYWIFISSVTPKSTLFATPIDYFPGSFTFQNYVDLFVKLGVGEMAYNTMLITFFSLVVSVIFGVAAAYAFARFPSKGLTLAYVLLLFSTLIPGIITARPLYDFMRAVKLIDTISGLTILYASALLPFSVLVLHNFIKQIPISIEEAAEVDGANFFQILFRIVLPLMKPAVATISIINYITSLNEMFTP